MFSVSTDKNEDLNLNNDGGLKAQDKDYDM